MKLYVISKAHSGKIYLNITFPHRQAMRNYFRGDWFTINDGFSYAVTETYAEAEQNNNAIAGTIIGGLIGLLAGPEGAIIGAGMGAAIGSSTNNDENRAVNAFNSSN